MKGIGTRVCALLAILAVGQPCSATPAHYPAPAGAVPVIIVPGIGGSELARGGEILWPPAGDAALAKADVRGFADILAAVARVLDRLQALSLAEPSADAKSIYPLRSLAGSLPESGRIGTGDSCRALFDALSRAVGSDNVYFFGYDWRRDNGATGAELARFVESVKTARGARRVDIVAHSMGGLVVSAFLAEPGSARSVRHVILAGSPLGGSGSARATLLPEAAGFSAVNLLSLATVLPDGQAGLPSGNGSSVDEIARGFDRAIRDLAGDYPSMYELLLPADFGSIATVQASHSPIRRRALDAARGYRDRVLTRLPSLYSGIDLHLVVGSGASTLDGNGQYVDGDGIVSVASATAGGVFSRKAKPFTVDHVGLVKNRACVDYIVGICSGP